VALTLRTLGGLSTPEIARAFLDAEATMGQRLSRAKAKISAAGIPFKIPEPEDLADRLNSVLAVIYLIFNAGYTFGPSLDRDLCDEAIFLARMLNALIPGEAEVEGCLALLLLTHARRNARLRDGETISLADQDQSLWDAAMLDQGRAQLDAALTRAKPGPFQIKAAIAACLSQSPPDWPQIAALYSGLYQHEPTPVIRLNHAVAFAEAGNLPAALAVLQDLAGPLAGYQPFHAAFAEYLGRAGHRGAALEAYARAIDLAASPADAAFLTRRRDRLLS
jgi:RNA polymerase sigma-70 factor (ECF subfamily)